MKTFLIVAMFWGGLYVQQQQTAREIPAPVGEIFKQTREWEQSTTPGVKAELKLVEKIEHGGRSLFAYDLKITGADQDKKYTLVQWSVNDTKPSIQMEGLRIDDDGSVFCPANSSDSCTKQHAGAVIQVGLVAGKGDIFRGAVVSEDKKTGAFFVLVPDPITANDHSCAISVVRLTPGFVMAVVLGKGFEPREHLILHAEALGELHDSETNADSSGSVYAELLPTANGKKKGRTDLTVRGKACAPKISFNWSLPD